jgi:hypothetical protein
MQLKRRLMYFAIVPVIAAAVPSAAWIINDRDTTSVDVPNLHLVADLSDGRLKMYEADTLLWQYPISPGKEGYPTPTGDYRIRKLIWNPRWVPPKSDWARKYTPKGPGEPGNPMKVVKIFFKEPVYYIHGTSEVHKLGQPASHGCIRMDPEHVAEVAKYIMEHGGQPREESWFWRVLNFRREERPITLRNPIPLRVKA